MERSGSVGDVLKVAQELSNVRQSIEQINAQRLQNQVAYSTITLSLEAAVSTTTPERSIGSQVQETWNTSTYSLRNSALVCLGIWLMVYSPFYYFATAIYGYIKLQKSHARPITQHRNHLTPTTEKISCCHLHFQVLATKTTRSGSECQDRR